MDNILLLGASDSLSSTSEAGNASGPEMNTGDIGDNGKPLSFARIASLNLEKQAIGQKSPKNAGVEGTMVPSSGSGKQSSHNCISSPGNAIDYKILKTRGYNSKISSFNKYIPT